MQDFYTDKRSTLRLSDALLIAAAPAVAYFATYSFEAGYASYFHISRQWVSVDLSSLLRYGFPAVVIGLFFAALIDLPTAFFSSGGRVALAIATPFAPLLLVTVVAAATMGMHESKWLWAVLGAVLLVGLQFALPFLRPGKSSYRARLEERREQWGSRKSLAGAFMGTSGYSGSILLFSAWVLLIACYDLGNCIARHRDVFAVLDTDPSTVVLRIYGDKLVLARFNRSAKIVEPQRRIVLFSDKSELVYRLERIGPLEPTTIAGVGGATTGANTP